MKTMRTLLLLAATCCLTALAACGQNNVSFDTLETSRNVANENALFNAARWRAQLPIYAESKILGRGDSTQAADCPSGDGWASIDLVSADGAATTKLKCSTVSANLGCLLSSDFAQREQYSKQENRCDSHLPIPLKKLAQ